ncbi:MAG: ATP-binding domain-containing protein [Flavobacterium sp.]|nr:ATP-binding domain-containing protein [Flavobacterium sp.]
MFNGKTIHASKGLEAKVVFIIGLTEGSGGFPDVWLEDRLFQIIKTADYNLLLEEERRLFYVAITRAKDQLYLITEKGKESSFFKRNTRNLYHEK